MILGKNQRIRMSSKKYLERTKYTTSHSSFFKEETMKGSKSLTRFVRRFPKALKALGTSLEIEEIEELILIYIDMYESREINKGKINTLRFLKEVCTIGQRYAVSCSFKPIPFTKTSKDGLPILIGRFKKALRGTLEDRRCAICILQLYKMKSTDVTDYDLKPITDHGPSTFYNCEGTKTGDYFRFTGSKQNKRKAYAVSRAWSETLEEMFPKRLLRKRLEKLTESNRLHMSRKSGPNGPALANMYKDYISIRNDKKLLKYIQEICKITENSILSGIIDDMESSYLNYDNKESYDHSRLSLKNEPGAKVRVFAIVDYFSQSSLNGIHDFIFEWLKQQPEDGTFKQDTVSGKVKNFTELGIRNITEDLSQATNRIPLKGVLYEIALQMVGEDLAIQWINLLSDRDFVGPNNEVIRFGVGQPLGCKTSFGLLALWHHVVFRTALKLNRKKRNPIKPDYYVIGDDSACIKSLQGPYTYIVKDLCGVDISEGKGFSEEDILPNLNPISEKSINVSELAKRVYYNGLEVTPIPPTLMLEGLERPEGIVDLLFDIQRRGYKISPPTVCELAYLSYKPKQAIQLSTFPLWPAPLFREGNMLYVGMFNDEQCDRWYSETWNKIPRQTITFFAKLVMTNLVQDSINVVMDQINQLTDRTNLDEPMVDLDSLVFDLSMKRFYRIICKDLWFKLMIGEFDTPGLATARHSFDSVHSLELRKCIKKLTIINDYQQLITFKKDKRLEVRQYQARILKDIYNKVMSELQELDLGTF
jgi:hypothetical protein